MDSFGREERLQGAASSAVLLNMANSEDAADRDQIDDLLIAEKCAR